MKDFEYYLKKAGDYHGHICGGIIFGTKITLAAMKALGLDPEIKNKNLIVYTEVDRCMTDAVQVVTGCSLGHRSLKHLDYGKFAATFINTDTGIAVRATIKNDFVQDMSFDKLAVVVGGMPDEAIVSMQEVKMTVPETDLPGPPRKSTICSVCGEKIMDGKEVYRDNAAVCKGCAYTDFTI